MADIVAKISTLPGSFHKVERLWCDNHPNIRAVVCVQGETDSYGAETHDWCQECHNQYKREKRKIDARTGKCDWCSKTTTHLSNARDFEEGLYGRVYRVCKECIDLQKQTARDDLDEDPSDWD